MQIVINLSDKTYKDIKEENGIYSTDYGLSTRITGKVVGAIQSGTPLPEEIIKALEQEFCEDAVSRQAVKDIIHKYKNDSECLISWVMDSICDLPSVTPQHTEAEIQKMQEMEQAEIQKAYELGKEDNIKVLDKIREEIERQEKWLWQAGIKPYNVDIAFSSIKSVLAESEDKE